MATVKFRLRSNAKKQNTIYVYLSLGRKNFYELKSGFEIQPADWQDKVGYPKQNTPAGKNLHSDLKKLEAYLYDAHNIANSKGEIIDKFWVERKIKDCFDRVVKTDAEVLVNHIQHIIDNAATRKVKGKKGLGLTGSTISGYKTFLRITLEYQKTKGRTIRLTAINNQFVDSFTNWLIETKEYGMNYAGKQIDHLKAVCMDADRLGIAVHKFAKNIQSFSESDEDRFIVTLSFKELKKIREKKMPTKSLENVKTWLLIGCSLGQRLEDLFSVNPEDYRFNKDILYVDVVQGKTGKEVTVPLPSLFIRDLFLNHFPYKISSQNLNKYLKMVCEISEIDEIVEGKKMITNNKVRRKVLGNYPKYELVTSHSFRRSFATNFYKLKGMSTPILMEITGHKRESTFLTYINRQRDKDDNAALFVDYFNQLELE